MFTGMEVYIMLLDDGLKRELKDMDIALHNVFYGALNFSVSMIVPYKAG